MFAFARRILQGRSPFSADRGHLHHRIIDMGFNVRQSVSILYCICSILGILAIMLTEQRTAASLVILVVALVIGLFNYALLKNKNTRTLTGLQQTTEFDRVVLPEESKEAPASEESEQPTLANDQKPE